MFRHLRRLALGISTEEAGFDRRGFSTVDSRVRDRLERAGRSFIEGYLIGLEVGRASSIAERLETIALEFRGFAFEGAAMAFAVLDGLTPWRRNRLAEFIEHPGGGHVYMLHVGAGWAMARLPHLRWRVASYLAGFDPLLRWLILDGYGFHEGYFHWRRCFVEHVVLGGLPSYGQRAFDQGLGRSLWFVAGGDGRKAVSMLNGFVAERRPDLWSGLGLACAYAGGSSPETLTYLRESANECLVHLQQGVAFAAKARQLAQNPSADTELACSVLCRLSVSEAADYTDQALELLKRETVPSVGSATLSGQDPAYEMWRALVRARFCGVDTGSTQTPAASGAMLTLR